MVRPRGHQGGRPLGSDGDENEIRLVLFGPDDLSRLVSSGPDHLVGALWADHMYVYVINTCT